MSGVVLKTIAIFAAIELLVVGGLGALAAIRLGFPYVALTPISLAVYGLSLPAQVADVPLPRWHWGQLREGDGAGRGLEQAHVSLIPFRRSSTTRAHTGTGLLIGGLVGVAAATVFLIGFCGDPDTACGGDEVGRAVLIFVVPTAVAGALIGSLVRTER